MSDEKIFYLVGGPNGSGKSTLVHQIVKAGDIEILNLDDIASARKVSNIAAARQLLAEDLPRVLSLGHSFVLESTLSGTYDIRIIKRVRELQYRVIFVFAFLESVKQNIERVAQRVRAGGHDVAVDTICRRYEKSLHNFHKILPLVDKWLLIYNGSDGMSYNVACGTNTTTDVFNQEYYALFNDNCFDASVRRMLHFIEIGADAKRLADEGIECSLPFDAIEKAMRSKQR